MIRFYGLKNCDKCRKALKFAKAEGLKHSFHDFREEGLDAKRLDRWLSALGWEMVLNRKSTTWRNLPEADRMALDRAKARDLLLSNPTLVKRPVIECTNDVLIGFTKAEEDRLSHIARQMV